jgi:hypothetical protein
MRRSGSSSMQVVQVHLLLQQQLQLVVCKASAVALPLQLQPPQLLSLLAAGSLRGVEQATLQLQLQTRLLLLQLVQPALQIQQLLAKHPLLLLLLGLVGLQQRVVVLRHGSCRGCVCLLRSIRAGRATRAASWLLPTR